MNKDGQDDRVGTATRILDVAERLVQVRGFNGFSYGDVAAELKITKAALHYHFAGKAELGEALIVRYAARFADALVEVEEGRPDAPARLDAYADLYLDVLRQQRMCLCGMMAAEFETLPTPMQDALIRFFDENERWLGHVLEQGRKEGTLDVRKFTDSDGPDHRQRPGGGDARHATLRRHHKVSRNRRPSSRRPKGHIADRRSASALPWGGRRRSWLAR